MKWLEWLWPIRTGITFFDYWSIAHFGFWFFVGSTVARNQDREKIFFACMMFAYAWESFERYAERFWPHIWQNPESWVNSLLSDPLMCVIGLLLAFHGYDMWRPK